MKLIVLQEKLNKGLNIVERISPKNFTLPILNTILLKAEKNFLKLTSTNLEIGINWWDLAKIENEGEVAIPVSLLLNFSTLLPNKKIYLEKKGNFLSITCENYKTLIKVFSSEEFPIFPHITKDNFFEIDSKLFCQNLEQVVDFTSLSSTRPEISGVYFSFQDKVLKLVTTDSFRLSEKTLFLEENKVFFSTKNKDFSFIIPQKTIKEVINIFSQKQESLKIYFSPNQVLFESQMEETPHPKIQLISRLIEGEFPVYQEIIPKKYDSQIILNRNEFLNHLKICALFSGKINEIKLKIDPKKNGIDFFSQNPDFGEHHSFINGKIKGQFLETSFNHRFLTAGILNIKSSEVVFELNKEEGPAVLKPVGDSTYFYIVMPIKKY